MAKNNTVKQLQCCLDSEGYAIVKNDPAKKAAFTEQDLFGVFSINEFLSFVTSDNC